MSIDATVGLIGDVFTAAAAVAAVVALVYARRTVVVAHAAEKEADTAAKEAAADRRRAANQAAAEGEDVMVEEDHDALYRQTYWNCQPCSYPAGVVAREAVGCGGGEQDVAVGSHRVDGRYLLGEPLAAAVHPHQESCLRAAGDRPVLGTFLNDPLDVLAEVVDHVEG